MKRLLIIGTSISDLLGKRLKFNCLNLKSTSFGVSWVVKPINSGFGWLLTNRHAKSSRFMSGIGARVVRKNSGKKFPRFIENTPRFIPTNTLPMKELFLPVSIGRFRKVRGKRITSSASTVRSDNAFLDWSEKRYLFQNTCKTISVLSNTLFVTITSPKLKQHNGALPVVHYPDLDRM